MIDYVCVCRYIRRDKVTTAAYLCICVCISMFLAIRHQMPVLHTGVCECACMY